MNKKLWWQKIKANYPLTLADCKGFFEMRFRENWRTKMQQPTELLAYFQEKYIRIDLRPLHRGMEGVKYSYKLYGNGIVIHRDPIFSERELAAFDSLEFAFRLREEYLERRQRTTNFVPTNRGQQVTRKKKTEGPTWGEQVRGGKI